MALVALGAFMGLAVDGAILVVVAFWLLTSLAVQIFGLPDFAFPVPVGRDALKSVTNNGLRELA